MLDGPNFYGGCKDATGRRSYQVQYRDVLGGEYVAMATIDDVIVGSYGINITTIGEP